MLRLRVVFALSLALFLLFAQPWTYSQEAPSATPTQASISGVVTDQTGAVVAAAKAVLAHGTEPARETVTNDKGEYSFKNVAPGTYTLTISAPNFKDFKTESLTIAGTESLPIDAVLEPAGEKTSVNVEGQTVSQVETENAQIAGTITEKEVLQIGLNGRNFTQLIALAPGVSNQTGQDEAKVGVLGSVKYSVNGGRVEYNSFEVDGSDVLNTGLNGAVSTLMVYPSLDSIQEVKVLTSNYGAQYGRTASGTVQVTTKSGAAALHGNIYDFVRNEAFNARNYFDISSPKAPLYRRQDFGGTLGGPLTIPHVYNTKKDKTFFFFSEEVRLEKTPTAYNQAVPSLKERGLVMTSQGIKPNFVSGPNGVLVQDFDFSDVCPLLSVPPPYTRQQYPDCPALPGSPNNLQIIRHLNQPVPPNQTSSGEGIDKNALAILNANLIPLPNSPYGCDYSVPNPDPTDPNHCYDANVSPSTYWREELFKIDHNLTAKLKLSFRYVHDTWNTTVLAPQWSILRTTYPAAATFPTIQNSFDGPGTDLVAKLTDTISSTLLNDFSASYANSTITLIDKNGPGGAVFQRNNSLSQPLVVDPSAPGQCNPAISVDPVTGNPQCAMGYIFNNGFGGKMPGVEILGTNAAYGGRGFAFDPGYMPWGHTSPTYALRDDVYKSIGHHTLEFGGQYLYSQRNQTNNAIGAASGEEQGFLTFSNLVRSTGNAFADFLAQTGSPPQSFIQSFSQDSAQHRYYQRFQIGEPYFQDDWKVTRKFTLNLGLRVSLFGTYHEQKNDVWNWEASKFQPMFAVDPCSGAVMLKSMAPCKGNSIQFNANTAQLPPNLVSEMGLVQCGVNAVPASCMTGHLFNPAPRIGFAWDPKGDGKTSIRAGYGIFYEHGTGNEANTGSLEASSPLVLSITQPFPYSYPCIGDVGYGSAFNSAAPCQNGVNPPAPPGSLFPLNVTAIPTKAVWPYAQQWSFGIQREIPHNFLTTVSYVGSRGTHLTLERNLNQLPDLPLSENPFSPNEPLTLADCTVAPAGLGTVPGDGTTPFLLQNGALVMPSSPAYFHLQAACASPLIPNPNSLPHPYLGLGQVLSLENVAVSTYHALQATMRHVSGPLTLGVSYSYSHSIDDSSDRSDPILVDSYDLRENRASSNFDERHLLNVSYIYNLDGVGKRVQSWMTGHQGDLTGDGQDVSERPSAFVRILTEGWGVEGVTLYQSGVPFTVINNAGNTGISLTDNAGVDSGFGIAESYPDVVKGPHYTYNNTLSFGPLLGNPSEFVAPRGLTFGDAGRNFLNNPGRLNFDFSLMKHFKPTESSEMQFRVEAFNVFNHTEFRIYDPDNPGGTGNNVISCYAGPSYSAGFIGKGGADCITGASFLHPIDAHRPRTIQLGLKWGF